MKIIYECRQYTIIPLELYEEELAQNYFRYNQPKKENEIILYNILRKNNSIILFNQEKTLSKLLDSFFPDSTLYLHTTPLAEYFAGKSKLGNNYKMYVNLSDNGIDIFCFERGQLLFLNSFPCHLPEDRSYYLLYVWKQLGLDQERDELHLAGHPTGREELIRILKRFIKQVFVNNPPSQYNYISEHSTEDIPFDLQSIYLCEL